MASDTERPVPVAIIGLGCLFPKADAARRFWTNVRDGVDAITEVPPTHWRPEDYFDADPKAPDRTYAVRGGFLDPVDFAPLEFGLSPNTLEATDTTQLLGLVAAQQALADAGYGPGRAFDRSRVSVVLGVTGTLELVIPLAARLGHPLWRKALQESGVSEATTEEVVRRIGNGYVGWQEDSFPGLLGNVVAGRIANRLDFGGTNCVVDAACASSLGAVHLAMLELAAGRSDMVLTGGMDTFNDIFMYMCFSKTPALSPTGDARPFSSNGDGTILGEGLGCVVLKRLDDAERDGDRIYAVIRAVGSSSDGKGQAIYAPSSEGQTRALNATYRLAGVSPDSIELVEAHGTGTQAGDKAEAAALSEVYRASGREGAWCALGSVKSQIGHTKAAAGAAGLMKAALALHHKVLPPTIKVDKPIDGLMPGQSPFYVNTEKRPWLPSASHPRRAAVSAFGFGGSNYHCVLEEYGSEKEEVDWDGDVQILAFSSDSPEGLESELAAWPSGCSWEVVRREAARTRARFQSTDSHRLVMVVERRKGDVDRLIGQARAVCSRPASPASAGIPDGIYHAEGPPAGDLVLLFPGQGAQYPGMFLDLACRFPEMQRALAEADSAFANDREGVGLTRRLSDYIYPQPGFDREARRRDEEALRATEVAQPALGAVSLGAALILDAFGVKPGAVAGHSYGELPSLCIAGRFDSETLHRLSRLRGKSMAEGTGDRGAMLAVLAERDAIEAVLGEDGLSLVVANKNAPRQSVLSGASTEIARARKAFARREIESVPLSVSAAFHSPFVAEARHRFSAALEDINLRTGEIPVYANTTGRAYPDDPRQARDLLAGQLAEPVEFVSLVENMYEAGYRTFLEVGPSHKLTGLVNAILKEQPHAAFSVDAAAGSRGDLVDLARSLAQLAALGHDVNLKKWDDGPALPTPRVDPKKPTLTVPLCGANYVKPKPPEPPAQAGRRVVSPMPTDVAGAHAQNGTHLRNASLVNGAPVNGHKPDLKSLRPPVSTTPARPSPPAAQFPQISAPAPVSPSPEAPLPLHRGLVALQELGEQTARLHRQFLEGQDRALQVLQMLLESKPEGIASSPPESLIAVPRPVTPTFREIKTAPAPLPPEKPTPPASMRESTPIPKAPVAPPPPASPVENRVESTLLTVVAEKTGYPPEMLEFSMEIEADLGIDSIKRVEIFGALQERLPDSPAIRAEHLGTLRTLRQVADFLAGPSTRAESAAPIHSDRIESTLLAVVAEKTGYPPEMLEFSMEIEGDLGIDSIKRVEIFGAIQERLPDSPPIRAEHLGTLRTLRQVADFLAGPSASAVVDLPMLSNQVESTLLAVVAEKTGYPPEMLEFSMEIEADLGIDSIKRVEIFGALQERLPDSPAIRAEHLGTLRTLRQVADFLAGSAAPREELSIAQCPVKPCRPTALAPLSRHVVSTVPLTDLAAPAAGGLLEGGDVWVTSDGSDLPKAIASELASQGFRPRLISTAEIETVDISTRLSGLVMIAPHDGSSDAFLRESLRLLQLAGPGLRSSGKVGGSALVTVARLDGGFGFTRAGAPIDAVSGGLAGFAKTASHEWPEVRCRAIDLDPGFPDTAEAARRIVGEMRHNGPTEVGLSASGRCALELRLSPIEGQGSARPLARGDVVVISGGARGVTAEVAEALAREFSPTLVLLGRSPEPKAEPDWLASLNDEIDIKRALHSRMGKDASPREIETEYRAIQAHREARRNLARIASAGGIVVYRQVDVRDGEAVSKALSGVVQEFGPIRGIVHGAGVLADALIEAKSIESFDLVYQTKVNGLRSLLRAAPLDSLSLLVLFSSSTGRFGRTGQVDYAVANEVLNKMAGAEAQRRPGCRVISVNWGPWNGGMVTPGLKRIFEAEGVGLIEPDAGAAYLLREITQTDDPPVEVVVLGGEGLPTPVSTTPSSPPLSMVFERELTLEAFPVLRSHVIDGRAVLPMAITLEWLAHAAMHGQPGLSFHGVDGLRVHRGVFVEETTPYPVRVYSGKPVKTGGHFLVPTELRGGPIDREVVHARANVVLVESLPEPVPAFDLARFAPYPRDKAEIYSDILFHGNDLQAILHVEGCSEQGIAASVSSAPPPRDWIDLPPRGTWLADPLVLDAAFQAMIVWSFERQGAGSLPCYLGEYRQYRRAFPKSGVRIQARVVKETPQLVVAEIVILDTSGEVVAMLIGYESVIDVSLNQAFRRNRPSR